MHRGDRCTTRKRVMNSTPQFAIFAVACCLFVGYLLSFPWSGPMVDLDGVENFRIPMPTLNETCDVRSSVNTSLQLAYVDCGVSFLVAAFCLVYILSPKKGTRWPLEILWTASFLVFALEMVTFSVVVARISVWFLSCNNAAKLEGSCPTTRFRQLRGDIGDREQCYFDSRTLTIFSAENDQFSSCLETSGLATYNRRFARWDISAYYSAQALCHRDEPSQNLAWCYYYGCDPVCNHDAYGLNMRWFLLDVLLLLTILATHLITFGSLYVVRDINIKGE